LDFNESDLNDLLQQTTGACLHDSKLQQPCSSKDMNNEEPHCFSATNIKNIINTNSAVSQCVRDYTNSHEEPLHKVARKSYRMAFDELLARSSTIERLPAYNFESYQNLTNKDSIEKENPIGNDNTEDAAQVGEANEKKGAQNVTNSTDKCDEDVTEDGGPTYLDHLVNAIGHPEVLKHISAQLLKNVALQPPSNDKKKF